MKDFNELFVLGRILANEWRYPSITKKYRKTWNKAYVLLQSWGVSHTNTIIIIERFRDGKRVDLRRYSNDIQR